MAQKIRTNGKILSFQVSALDAIALSFWRAMTKPGMYSQEDCFRKPLVDKTKNAVLGFRHFHTVPDGFSNQSLVETGRDVRWYGDSTVRDMVQHMTLFSLLPKVEEELVEWLEGLLANIPAHKWAVLANDFCMIGVKPESMVVVEKHNPGFEVLGWLDANQDTWNRIVLEALKDQGEAKNQIKKHIRADIRRLKNGEMPKIFADREHAEWCLEYLQD